MHRCSRLLRNSALPCPLDSYAYALFERFDMHGVWLKGLRDVDSMLMLTPLVLLARLLVVAVAVAQ